MSRKFSNLTLAFCLRGILIFSGAVLIFPPALPAEQFEIWAEHSDALYRFQEHLLEAEASVLLKGREPLIGTWKEDRFYFPELTPLAQVKLIEEQSPEGKGKAVRFNPVEKAVRRLVFHDVPPGSRLDFFYKVSAGSKKEPSPYLLLKILAGRHLIKSMRIFQQDENWKKEEIDLGVAAFLKRRTLVTFEVSSDLTENLLFTFAGEIRQ